MSKPYVHIRFKTPNGWKNFYLKEDSVRDDVLKQIQKHFGATEFKILTYDGPDAALKGLDAVYQEEK